jgi:beta-glucosidase
MKKLLGVVLSALLLAGCGSDKPSVTPIKVTEQNIDSVINLMTLDEKITMIHSESSFTSGGVPRLGIPSWKMSDGPHGIRKEHGTDYVPDEGVKDSVTYLPVGVTLASTWNPQLGYEYGKVLGEEAKARGKDVVLGPGVNIIRTPVNGRNFEYLSEDPYLASRMAVGYIKGVQDQDIAVSVKHYAANNQEVDRNSVNVEMSERALREIYLPAFKAAVQEGKAYTLMGAYNKFRGQFCTHNEYLVNTILKGEWGFDGVLMSDWGAVHNTLDAINYGTDLEMGTDLSLGPNPDYNKYFLADPTKALIKEGKVDEKLIDEKVRRILRIMVRTKMFGTRAPSAVNTPEHQSVAFKVASEGIVLLKNDGILPLKRSALKTLAVIGANGSRKHAGAGGSSQVNAKYEVTPLAGITGLAGDNVEIKYAAGYEILKDWKANPALVEEAVQVAAAADVVVYAGGWIHGYSDLWNDNAFDSESVDKPGMNLPFGQDELIEAILKVNPNAIIILNSGAATDMQRWVGKARAIIQAWYPGMEGGTALTKIIFGDINPSGKLPMTFPKTLTDVPAHNSAIGEYPGKDGVVRYNEGILNGYRYYDTKKVEPQFAFGFGLSYTRFSISNIKTEKQGSGVTVSVDVKNTGAMAGAEVVQVYVKDDKSSVERPEKELKAFEKVSLNPGESKTVTLTLDENAFKFYDENQKAWTMEPGGFTILVGSSSRDIKQTAKVTF